MWITVWNPLLWVPYSYQLRIQRCLRPRWCSLIMLLMLQSSARHYLGMGSVTAAEHAAPLGHSPSPLGSSGADQLQAQGVGPLSSSSSALSPTSLLFPLTPSPSFPPSLSSALPPPPSGSSLSSYSSAVSSLPSSVSSSSSTPIPSLSLLPSLILPCPRLPSLPPSASSLFFFFFIACFVFFFFLFPFVFSSFRFRLGLLSLLSLLLLDSLLPLSLPRLLFPPLRLLFPFLLFRCMLPLPPFYRLQLLLLAVLPRHLPFLLLLPWVLSLPWRNTRRVCWGCLLNISR